MKQLLICWDWEGELLVITNRSIFAGSYPALTDTFWHSNLTFTSPLSNLIYSHTPVPLRLRFTPSFPLAGSGGGNFRSQGDKMTMKEMTPERAYRNYVNNGMRIVVDNGVLKGIIRDW